MYLCGFGAEWLFASIFTYFVIFVLQHDPAMVAGLNSLNSILQLISTALFIGLCVKRASANPISRRWGSSFRGSAVYLAVVFPSTVRPGDSADVRHYRAVRLGYRRGLLYTGPFTPSPPMSMRSHRTPAGRDSCRRHDLLRKNSALDCGVLDGGDPELLRFPVKSAQPTGKRGDRYRSGILRRGDRISPAAIVFSKQMKLDRKAHLVVLQEVARIKAGGKISDIAPDVRVIVEDLVGHRYEECWGNSKLFKDAACACADRRFIKEEGPAGIRRGTVLCVSSCGVNFSSINAIAFAPREGVTGSAEAGWLAKSIAFS